MIIDGHVHFEGIDLAGKMLEDQKRTGAEQFNILVIGRDRNDPNCFKQAEAIWFKLKYPKQVFAFGGLDYSGMIDRGLAEPDVPFLTQVKTLREVGFDGLKLLSGKPDARKRMGQPLDGAVFTPMLRWLEETQFPITWHVGDPPEFWNPEAVPLWAKKNRWWYDETHPPKSQIDREIAAVIDRHPKLNLIFPHFFFMSTDLKAAGAFLDKYPNISLDLAPGVEMLHNFTANHQAARNFFVKYADRIVFGTDMGMFGHGTGPKRGWMIRHFLETDEHFEVPDDPAMTPDDRPPLHGIALPPAVLTKIYSGNFRRILGTNSPKPLNKAAVKKMCQALIEQGRSKGEACQAANEVLKMLG